MFDQIIVVDWSANSSPKLGRDSIWIAVRDERGGRVENLATRTAAESFLVELLSARPGATTLLGVDFTLGYPAGTAARLGLEGEAWLAMWALLVDLMRDDHRNANNRFTVAAELNARLTGTAAPFWGCPPSRTTYTLAPTKPADAGDLPPWRQVEHVLRTQGRRPFSVWQLLGAGAVGSQSLLGIPMLARLRHRVAQRVEVWPFTTGLCPPEEFDGAVVVAEVWPSLLPVDCPDGVVRDAAQVTALAHWLAAIDAEGSLADYFSPVLDGEVAAAACSEEGWVLGVVA